MRAVFEVVDQLEISRERIQVELLPEGEGSVERLANNKIGIVLPASCTIEQWQEELRNRLTELQIPEDNVDQGV